MRSDNSHPDGMILAAQISMADRLGVAVAILLCAAAVVFPFSVAATNVALGVVLALGILSGIWWQGTVRIWLHYRGLCIAMMLYWGIVLLGLSWSHDLMWGMHVVGRQWGWLLIPVITSVMISESWRRRFLALLSLGLVLHLLFCVLQKFGYVTVSLSGSTADDATGHIGHIGFGAVYGMWAGWLLLWGWRRTSWQRIGAWSAAVWAWSFIFMAQGRGGYIVALALLLAVLWKIFFRKGDWRWAVWIAGLALLVFGVLALGPGKERLQVTWQNIQAIERGEISKAGPRWSMWLGALDAWRMHPFLGVGTGGFPGASAEVARLHPGLNYGGSTGKIAVHPHNMYLLALARWSVWGLGALLGLLYIWGRTGWRMDWFASESGALIYLSSLALAVQGITEPSLEEHFEIILAIMLLSAGLAMAQDRRNGDGSVV